jgi:hypothetical protein
MALFAACIVLMPILAALFAVAAILKDFFTGKP